MRSDSDCDPHADADATEAHVTCSGRPHESRWMTRLHFDPVYKCEAKYPSHTVRIRPTLGSSKPCWMDGWMDGPWFVTSTVSASDWLSCCPYSWTISGADKCEKWSKILLINVPINGKHVGMNTDLSHQTIIPAGDSCSMTSSVVIGCIAYTILPLSHQHRFCPS